MASAGEADTPGFGATLPGADPYHLLMHSRGVQKELGLTAEQIHRLYRADRDFRSGMRDLEPSQDGVASNGNPVAQREQIERHLQKTKGVIAKVLTPEQSRRLLEISFQINGPCLILMDPGLAAPLAFTPEQKSQVQSLCGRMADQMRDSLGGLEGGDAAERCVALKEKRRQMQELREETNRHIRDLLTEKQTATYAKLVGKPFEFDPARGGPPCPGETKLNGGPRQPPKKL